MYSQPNPLLEKGRITTPGPLVSDVSYGNNGAFQVVCPLTKVTLNLVVSDGGGWEHVSVSVAYHKKVPQNVRRCPTWEEMHWVKEQLWLPEEAVMELHPPASAYVNCHPFCLHLWRPLDVRIPLPPTMMVGPRWPVLNPLTQEVS